MARNRILIVDDESAIRFGIRDFLETHLYQVDEAASCRGALESFRNSRPDAVIVDYRLPDGTALELLPKLKEIDAAVPLIVLTGHGSIDLAVRAVKEGAEHFLTKPVELPALLVILQRLLENQRNRQKQLAGRSREARDLVDPFVGTSSAIRELAEEAERIVAAETAVLIQGETGTGKGVLARWIHCRGPRADEAFVDLNCAGLAREFLETELFGHEKGAFTGAIVSKQGLLEIAQRGTLFLDEIGDMEPQVQPKLLKVLEEKRFRRMGDVRDRQADVRLIAATHQNLRTGAEKKFRADLYFRISAFQLIIPPLRTRAEDLPMLCCSLLSRLCTDLGRREAILADDAEQALARHPWPGNIRELRNVLERALLLSDRDVLSRRDLRFDETEAAAPAYDGDLTLDELERAHIQRILQDERGRVDVAAQRLGVPRSSLYQKIKKYGIDIPKS